MVFLTEDQLNKLTTKRLLLYKRKNFPYNGIRWRKCIYNCEIFTEWEDCKTCETFGKKYFETYEVIKLILSKREHMGE